MRNHLWGNSLISMVGVFVVAVLVSAGPAKANTTCNLFKNIAPNLARDGDEGDFISAANQRRWFRFRAVGGRSYSVTATIPFDDQNDALTTGNAATSPDTVVELYSGCSGGSGTGLFVTNDDAFIDPVHSLGSTASFRATEERGCSFNAICVVYVSVRGFAGTWSFSFRIRIDETTMFGPFWFTGGDFNTFIALQNTTRGNITWTVSYILLGTTTVGATFSRTSEATKSIVISSRAVSGIAAGQQGSFIVTHDGPPGAIKGVGQLIGRGGAVFVPIPLVSRGLE